MNNYKAQVNIDRSDLGTSIPLKTPYVIYIEPSGYCNLKCNFCMHGSEQQFTRGLMPVSRFEKVIDELNNFEDKIKLLRVCGNGDPLMNKKILDMLRYASQNRNNIGNA